jgi:cobalt-zinc-cadmium efflux system protein
VAEVIGGIWSNSLALLSDAGHVFLDLFALLLSLGAIKLAAQPASERHSYGLHRTEVLASLINGLTVFIMALGILYEGSKRLASPEEVKTIPMLVIAVLGLIANLLAAKGLHGHSHDDLNVRSAFLHVLGDAAASVGVIAGALLMRYTGWYQADPLISIAIGLLILVGAGSLLREAVHILMEGVPRGLSVEQVAESVRSIDGVLDVHHLNIWSVCSHIFALSAHVEIDPAYDGQRSQLLHRIEHLLRHNFHITHTTIQFDCSACNGGPLIKELGHTERHTTCNGH